MSWLRIALLYILITEVKLHKEYIKVISGSDYRDRSGIITAPPTFDDGYGYKLDRTSYIFILENMEIDGSVELKIDILHIHPDSWITVRNSKYGGYLGQFIGRYDWNNPPPYIIFTDTCCLRVEFQTGCCKRQSKPFTGFQASYSFVHNPGKGRRASCTDWKKYPQQLCNGECIRSIYRCPCARQGDFRCKNGLCISRDKVCDVTYDCADQSDETYCTYNKITTTRSADREPLYAFSVVIVTVCTAIGIVATLLILLCLGENGYKRHCQVVLFMSQAARLSTPSLTGSRSSKVAITVDTKYTSHGHGATYPLPDHVYENDWIAT